jgi:poly-beta-hydroxyalkanoate depolymerase
MNMNLERHMKAHRDLFNHIAKPAKTPEGAAIRAFYDEYFAVLDLDADFYLETVRLFFQEDALARGTLTFRGQPVPGRDQTHGTAHRRGRKRRHLRPRPNARRARTLQRPAPAS